MTTFEFFNDDLFGERDNLDLEAMKWFVNRGENIKKQEPQRFFYKHNKKE